MEPLDEMLAEFQQAGSLDSHGHFSIDFGQALKSIGAQLLPDPRMYALRFYQSAVCGRADDVSFAGNLWNIHCRSLGPPLPLEQLRDLSSFLAPDSRNLAAHYLATALHAALATRPRRLQLVTWDGQEGASLTFLRGKESVHVLNSCPFANLMPQTGMLVQRGPNWFFRQVPEWEWLRRQAGLGRASLRIDGSEVEPAFGSARDLISHKLYLPGTYIASHSTRHRSAAATCQKGYHVFRRTLPAPAEHPLEDSIFLNDGVGLRAAVGIRADLTGKASLRFVRHGVMLAPVQCKSSVPGLEIVISAAGFKTDLSGFKMVEDDHYRAACQHMLEVGEQLWTEKRQGKSYRDCVAEELLGEPGARYSAF